MHQVAESCLEHLQAIYVFDHYLTLMMTIANAKMRLCLTLVYRKLILPFQNLSLIGYFLGNGINIYAHKLAEENRPVTFILN